MIAQQIKPEVEDARIVVDAAVVVVPRRSSGARHPVSPQIRVGLAVLVGVAHRAQRAT